MDSIINEPVRGTIGDMSFLAVPGIDALRRAVRGEAPRPPIHHLTGITPTEVGLGKMTFKMPVTRWLEDAVGIIWGGVYAFFADAPISLALYSGLPAGKLLSTSELSINYLRPATRDSGHLIGRAQSVYLGREVGVSEATIEDQHGRTLAHATTRCVIQDFPVDPDIEPSVPEPPITDPPDPYLRTPPDDAWQDPAIFDTDKIPVMKKFIDGVISPGPVQAAHREPFHVGGARQGIDLVAGQPVVQCRRAGDVRGGLGMGVRHRNRLGRVVDVRCGSGGGDTRSAGAFLASGDARWKQPHRDR